MKCDMRLYLLAAAVSSIIWFTGCSSAEDVTMTEQETDTSVTQGLSVTAAVSGSETTAEPAEAGYTDVAVLSTTDMHGRCWDKNILTDTAESSNMLSVSSAVKEIREEYGDENVILIDNGDIFQGTPISQVQMENYLSGTSHDPLAMAVCLKEIGYDAFNLGNHEFNFDWGMMSDTYKYLESSGVPVISGNICYDGTDGVHNAGDTVFEPYIIKSITVDGHEHKIGILGFENTDITRWDVPVNYPGLQFVHPGNDDLQISREAEIYLPEMKKKGCEFIITAYHSALGNDDGDLVFGTNTDDQGKRLITETAGIDMLILGHDHSNGYSNTYEKNADGQDVLVVNGGSKDLTESVFRFSENEDGKLVYTVLDSHNISLSEYPSDPELRDIISPYAETALEDVSQPLGSVTGEWDLSNNYYISQTDSLDLVGAACIWAATDRMERDSITQEQTGTDHTDADMAVNTVTTSGGYVVSPGNISMRDIYKLYRFSNSMIVIPMTGKQIRDIMEENASERLNARVIDGTPYFYMKNDSSTNLIFSGVNFTYDISKPEGQRVSIEGFGNGRPFDEDNTYLVAVNNYILGNEKCGLRDFSLEDAVWSQTDAGDEENMQDMIAEYIAGKCKENGSLTPDVINWHWSMEFTEKQDTPDDENVSALLVHDIEPGNEYILYSESHGTVMTGAGSDDCFTVAEIEACGNALIEDIPEDAIRLTVETKDGKYLFRDRNGKYLSCYGSGTLKLDEKTDGNSEWTIEDTADGKYIISGCSEDEKIALEFYGSRITTYPLLHTGIYIFNFYEEVPEKD